MLTDVEKNMQASANNQTNIMLGGKNIPIDPNDLINRLRAYIDQKDKKPKPHCKTNLIY